MNMDERNEQRLWTEAAARETRLHCCEADKKAMFLKYRDRDSGVIVRAKRMSKPFEMDAKQAGQKGLKGKAGDYLVLDVKTGRMYPLDERIFLEGSEKIDRR